MTSLLTIGVLCMVLAIVCFYGLPKFAPRILKRMEEKQAEPFSEREQRHKTEKIVLVMRIMAFVFALAAAGVLAIDTFFMS
ncbi:MAG: hypothetical protein ACYCX2_10260 [Christensenellales bacterium]